MLRDNGGLKDRKGAEVSIPDHGNYFIDCLLNYTILKSFSFNYDMPKIIINSVSYTQSQIFSEFLCLFGLEIVISLGINDNSFKYSNNH